MASKWTSMVFYIAGKKINIASQFVFLFLVFLLSISNWMSKGHIWAERYELCAAILCVLHANYIFFFAKCKTILFWQSSFCRGRYEITIYNMCVCSKCSCIKQLRKLHGNAWKYKSSICVSVYHIQYKSIYSFRCFTVCAPSCAKILFSRYVWTKHSILV